jgi:hypothetical protein
MFGDRDKLYEPADLGWLWGMRLIMAFLLVAFLVLLISPAPAHDHGQFGQYSAVRDQWLQNQTNPKTGGHCCTGADATLVTEDIRYDDKGVGHYWIKWGQYEWTQVPDIAVLPKGNPNGEPVVWFSPRWGTDNKATPLIHCYAPGAGL